MNRICLDFTYLAEESSLVATHMDNTQTKREIKRCDNINVSVCHYKRLVLFNNALRSTV